MPNQLKAHEFLHVQEHIRTEAAAAAMCRQAAQECSDAKLKQFVETQAQLSENLVQQLTSFLKG